MSWSKASGSLVILVLWLTAACSSPPATEQAAENPALAQTVTPTVAEPVKMAAATATVLPEIASPIPTDEPAVPVTPSADFQVCSPLQWETIPELWEILSDPYAPPPPGRDERHHGADFSHWSRKGRSTIQGEPVQSILAGRVATVVIDRLPYGNMIIIETPQEYFPEAFFQALGGQPGESLYTLYAHFDDPPLVGLGDMVSCGNVIGAVGMTGYNVVNAHLHIETRLGPSDVTFGSMAFYTTTATQEEMETYKRWRTSGEFRHFDPMKLFQLFLDYSEGGSDVPSGYGFFKKA